MTGKNETIVDRVVMRLKAQPLGDLITEEDLHDIVKEAIPKVFFERQRVIDRSGYNNREIEKDPIIVEVMRDLLQTKAKELVAAWMIDHREEMLAYWKQVMDQGLRAYIDQLQTAEVRAHISDVLRPWLNEMNNARVQQGLPMLPL